MENIEQQLYYGLVMVTKGKYKGEVGYYDDDEGLSTGIVYFDTPFITDYNMIRHSSMRNLHEKEIEALEVVDNKLFRKLHLIRPD